MSNENEVQDEAVAVVYGAEFNDKNFKKAYAGFSGAYPELVMKLETFKKNGVLLQASEFESKGRQYKKTVKQLGVFLDCPETILRMALEFLYTD